MMALKGENQYRGSSQSWISFHSALKARSEHLYSCSLSSMLISASTPLAIADILFIVSSDILFLVSSGFGLWQDRRVFAFHGDQSAMQGSIYCISGILFRRDCMRRKARIAASTRTGGPRMNIAFSLDMLYIML